MPNPKRIVSQTKGATITKMGQTSSGQYGTSTSAKKSHKTRTLNPKGGK